jgi:hypothetical protein
VKESIDRLIRNGVLGADATIAPAWRQPVTLQLVRREGGAAVLAAVRAVAPKSLREQEIYRHWQATAPHLDSHLARSVRLAALANDGEAVERLIEIAIQATAREASPVTLAPWLLRGCPADLEFIESLSLPLRDRVASAHVELFIAHGVIDDDISALINALRSHDRDWSAAPPSMKLSGERRWRAWPPPRRAAAKSRCASWPRSPGCGAPPATRPSSIRQRDWKAPS